MTLQANSCPVAFSLAILTTENPAIKIDGMK